MCPQSGQIIKAASFMQQLIDLLWTRGWTGFLTQPAYVPAAQAAAVQTTHEGTR